MLLQVFHRKWIQSGGKEHTEYAVNADIIVQARVATFLRGWPNNKSGWKCTPEKVGVYGSGVRETSN